MFNNIIHTVTADDIQAISDLEASWAKNLDAAMGRWAEDLTGGSNWTHPYSQSQRADELVDRLDVKWGSVEVKTTRTGTVTLGDRRHVAKQGQHADFLFVYRWADGTPIASALVAGDIVQLELVCICQYGNVMLCLQESRYGENWYVYITDADRPNGGTGSRALTLETFNLLTFEDD